MSTIYPISHLGKLGDPSECPGDHEELCRVAGVSPTDPEIGCRLVEDPEDADRAITAAGKRLPAADEPEEDVRADYYVAVCGHV